MFRWGPPYTQGQLDDAQARWGIRFPPDLVDLFLDRRPVFDGNGNIDWVQTPDTVIQKRFGWPLHGFWFDVLHAGLWWPEWGERPVKREDQYAVLKKAFESAPKLIPIFAHRYIPETPHEAGNPVFSVHQSDVIHYGADLMDYIERERTGWDDKPWPLSIKEIPFWTHAAEYDHR